MQIEDKDVLHIAKLARLKLADNELESYKKNLQEILDFADTINHVNTDDIGETIGINENYNVFRKDEIVQDSDKDELLANAPSQDEGMFRIPKVINYQKYSRFNKNHEDGNIERVYSWPHIYQEYQNTMKGEI